jgi:mannitol/fructose-specific phosphotransferase system IIA component (Ntr-type)
MLLGEILHREVIKPDLEAEDKYEAIEELVDLLVEAHELPMSLRDHVIEVVTEREKTMSTGMEKGIALPHGSTERIDDIIGALGLCRRGIPFESLDAEDARIVILLVLPKQNFQGHVRTLAGIAHLLGNAAFRETLLKAETVDDILALIESEEDKAVFTDLREKRE